MLRWLLVWVRRRPKTLGLAILAVGILAAAGGTRLQVETDFTKNFRKNNPDLGSRELNYAVQATIDRIIFLRICEDRGIETYGRLEILQNGANVYGRLFDQFREADQRYNSGLFHFRNEKGRTTAADQLTPNLKLDDRPLKKIMKGLYYPDCPYEFSMLSADILGQIYERFLGNVITVTKRRV